MSSRREYNREVFELWMLTSGTEVQLRPLVDNPGSQSSNTLGETMIPQAATWLDAISDPEARETHSLLTRLMAELLEDSSAKFATLWQLYLSPDSDPALLERWRRAAEAPGAIGNPEVAVEEKVLLMLTDRAFRWVLDRVGNRVLVWPEPEGTKEWFAEQRQKRHKALAVYYNRRDRGDTPGLARRKAADVSGASLAAVYLWTGKRKSEPKPEPATGPDADAG